MATSLPIHKTALGQTLIHTGLVVLVYLITFLISIFGNIHWPDTLPVFLPGIFLVAIIGIRNFADKELPNFPTSAQLVAIPKEVAEALHLITVVNTDVLPAVDTLLPADVAKTVNKIGSEAQDIAAKADAVTSQPVIPPAATQLSPAATTVPMSATTIPNVPPVQK